MKNHITTMHGEGERASECSFYEIRQSGVLAVDASKYPGIVTPADLYDALKAVWSADTCAPRMRDRWTKQNYTLGQCSITAFLAQDIFGGDVYGVPLGDGNYHCYNIVGNSVFDLTSEQFEALPKYGTKQVLAADDGQDFVITSDPKQFREVHFKKEEKKARYELLKERLEEYLHK